MRHAPLLAGLVLLFTIPAAAHAGSHGSGALPDNATVSDLLDHPDEIATVYNGNSDAIPGIVQSLVADERVNVHVTGPDGNTTIGAVFNGTTITAVHPGGVANATVTFTTDRATLETVAASDNPAQAAVEALNRGDIRYEVTGLWNTVMYGVISTILRIFGGLI